MRKIVAGLLVSLDGVVEAPEQWTGPFFVPEVGEHIGAMIAGGDTMLLGRLTYETFAASFAGQSGDIADQMNSFPKVVVSTTLEKAEWQNTTLIKDDVVAEITRLKRQSGKAINISGSATLVAWLLRKGLLDELDLLLFPVVVGGGKHLFERDCDRARLTLAESKAFSNGVLHLNYRPADAATS